ncbi:N-acetyltransferase [Paenibacillus albiflavus]|uniref:N-acetyltransferase n=1 Tax=Paenibacillus albiflavus TaxID=2545760 RepID=A0A4R4E632_9BACL|nr:GNAT family N-acetyltransferase [Paenibacillus albiflavus]TCZ75134.1 N-acetyltransferase [Paenibacillus albiflavus]
MLINLTSKLTDPNIKELISYAMFPDPERIETALKQYETDEALTLYGYEEDNNIVGLIGVQAEANDKLIIKHIAIQPENRMKGYGRGLILELIEQSKPLIIEAETDVDSVDFYRSIGFTVYSLGDLYPGVERFRCLYEVEPEEEDN